MGLRDALEIYSHCHVEGNGAYKAIEAFEKAVRVSEKRRQILKKQ